MGIITHVLRKSLHVYLRFVLVFVPCSSADQHLVELMDRQPDMPVTASANNFDNLDKAFVILRLPGPGRLHRRVDLISSPRERYAAAVLSWSGSMMFERDLK